MSFVGKKALGLILLGGVLLLVGFALGRGSAPVEQAQKINSLQVFPSITPTSASSFAPNPTHVLGTEAADMSLVTKVIDGDTIQIEGGKTLRYIGIDTPETSDPRRGVQCFGKEATLANKELVEGKMVRMEKDVSETDRFGRLLRYVFIDDMFVNDYLVRQGYAYASAYPPDITHQQLFDDAQREARENNRGLWASCKEDVQEVTPLRPTSPTSSGDFAGQDKDCSDFKTHNEAQAFFIAQGGPGKDPHRLDQDKDGVACESLP